MTSARAVGKASQVMAMTVPRLRAAISLATILVKRDICRRTRATEPRLVSLLASRVEPISAATLLGRFKPKPKCYQPYSAKPKE